MIEKRGEFSFRRNWGPKPHYENVLKYKNEDFHRVLIAGPCSMETIGSLERLAKVAKECGATHLRSGVFRAGTYPGKNFGWVQEDMIEAFSDIARSFGMKTVIEVLDYRDESFDLIAKYADVFQVGARSQQNYSLLRTLGQYGQPVFLKRNTGCTVDEWLGSAEHLFVGGVKDVVLIERGSSTFHNDVRWAPMIHTIPSVKSICDLPVIIDGSHSCGRRDLVSSIVLAGIAAGADGALIEFHEDPEKSLSDPDQALTVQEFEETAMMINRVRYAVRGLKE